MYGLTRCSPTCPLPLTSQLPLALQSIAPIAASVPSSVPQGQSARIKSARLNLHHQQDVAETPGLGTEYYYNVNLVGSSLMAEGDTSIFSVRYADGNTASTTSLSLDTRYPVTDRLRINPRLLVSYRDFSTSDSKEVIAVPALRLFYELQRHTRLEFEFGARLSDWDTETGSLQPDSPSYPVRAYSSDLPTCSVR